MRFIFALAFILVSSFSQAQEREIQKVSLLKVVNQLGLADTESEARVLFDSQDVIAGLKNDQDHPFIEAVVKSGLNPYEKFAANPSGNLIAIAFNPETAPLKSNLGEAVVISRVWNGEADILRIIRPSDEKFKGAPPTNLKFITPGILMIERTAEIDDQLVSGYQFYDVAAHQTREFADFINPAKDLDYVRIDFDREGTLTRKSISSEGRNVEQTSIRLIRNNIFAVMEKEGEAVFLSYYRMDDVAMRLYKIGEIHRADRAYSSMFWNPVDERDFFSFMKDGAWITYSDRTSKGWERKVLKVFAKDITIENEVLNSDQIRVPGRPDLILERGDDHTLRTGSHFFQEWSSKQLNYPVPIGVSGPYIVVKNANHPFYGYSGLTSGGNIVSFTDPKMRLIFEEMDRGSLRGLTSWDANFDFSFWNIAVTADGKLPQAPGNLLFAGELGGPLAERYPLVDEIVSEADGARRKYTIVRKSDHRVAIYDVNHRQWVKEIDVLNEPLKIIDGKDQLVLWHPRSKNSKVLRLPDFKVESSTYIDPDCNAILNQH